MANITYTQCEMARGQERTTAWIPSKFSKLGTVVDVLLESGAWSTGWSVTSAGTKLDEEYLPDPHADIKGHRRATGDAMTKTVIMRDRPILRNGAGAGRK